MKIRYLSNISLSPISAKILRVGLPLIAMLLLYIALRMLNAPPGDYVYIFKQSKLMLEHAMMSLTILVGGAFLYDRVIKENSND